MMKKQKVFVDMDGVIVDFEGYMNTNGLALDTVKYEAGHYGAMPPIAGAVEAVKQLIEWGYDVWIATKPPTGNASAYAEKADWIYRYIPELTEKIIITHHKGCLGNEDDYLIDDRPHKAFCSEFEGTLIEFVTNDPNQWAVILKKFELSRHSRSKK